MGAPRRIEVRVEPPPPPSPPATMAEALAREKELLERNQELHPVRRERPAEYSRVCDELTLVRRWIRARNRESNGAASPPRDEEERWKGSVRALHDVGAFGLFVLDEIDDEGALTPLGARFVAEVLESLPEGYFERWRVEKLKYKTRACEEDEDDPAVPPDLPPPDEAAVARCFARLRARCRRLHGAVDVDARRAPFCVCGLPNGGAPLPVCRDLAALASRPGPGGPPWLAAARELDGALAHREGRPEGFSAGP